MNAPVDHLSQRVTMWQTAPYGAQTQASQTLALQGWALGKLFERSAAPPPPDLDSLHVSLPAPDPSQIQLLLDHAQNGWESYLSELDREEENFEQVHELCADVFFTLLEAFTCAENLGSEADRQRARQLFNQVISEAGVFEPMAAEAQRLVQPYGAMQLSGLLCAGVIALHRDAEVLDEPLEQPVEREVGEFVSFGTLMRGAGRTKLVSLESLAQLISRSPWWYIKWCAQRVRLEVMVRSAQLRLEVYEGEGRQGREAVSKALDGWSVRLLNGGSPMTTQIQNGTAALKLGPKVDASAFTLQLKQATEREWQDLFGRVETQG